MINDCFAWAGFACVVVGAALVHPALGWLAAGAMLLSVGIGSAVVAARAKLREGAKKS